MALNLRNIDSDLHRRLKQGAKAAHRKLPDYCSSLFLAALAEQKAPHETEGVHTPAPPMVEIDDTPHSGTQFSKPFSSLPEKPSEILAGLACPRCSGEVKGWGDGVVRCEACYRNFPVAACEV